MYKYLHYQCVAVYTGCVYYVNSKFGVNVPTACINICCVILPSEHGLQPWFWYFLKFDHLKYPDHFHELFLSK